MSKILVNWVTGATTVNCGIGNLSHWSHLYKQPSHYKSPHFNLGPCHRSIIMALNIVITVEVVPESEASMAELPINRLKKDLTEENVNCSEKNFQCDICLKMYKTKHSLSQHKGVQHGGPRGQERMKKCDKCNNLFKINSFYSHKCIKDMKKMKA